MNEYIYIYIYIYIYDISSLRLKLNLIFVDPYIIVNSHRKESNNMQQFIKIYYSIFI